MPWQLPGSGCNELRHDLLWAYLNRKDSYTVLTELPNAFHHADGTLASPPVAPVQLQAEVHDALCGLASARHRTGIAGTGWKSAHGESGHACARRLLSITRVARSLRRPCRTSASRWPCARSGWGWRWIQQHSMGKTKSSAALRATCSPRRCCHPPVGVAGRARDEVRFEPFDYHSQVWAFAVHRTARGLARHGFPDLARELDGRVVEQTRDGLFPENVGACPDLRYCPHLLTVARPAPDGRPTVTVKERPPAPYAAWTVAAVLAIRGTRAV